MSDAADGTLPESVVLCPNCSTVLTDPEGSSCAQCGLQLNWLTPIERKELRAAIDPRRARLHLRLVWAGGERSESHPIPATIDLSIRDESVRVTLRNLDAPLVVEWGGGQRSVATPGGVDLGFARINARAGIEDPQYAAPPVGETSPHADDGIPYLSHPVTRLGKKIDGSAASFCLPHKDVAMQHAVVLRRQGEAGHRPTFWLVDLRSPTGTFVNRRPIVSTALRAGDLVQIGPFSFSFNQHDQCLVPVTGIAGVDLRLQHVTVRNRPPLIRKRKRTSEPLEGFRLNDVSRDIERGSLVAVVGQSGAGKSTLIRAILREPGFSDAGKILADGVDVDLQPDGFRDSLGYFSQKSTVHNDLTARQAVMFAARLRSVEDADVDRLLRQVELPESRFDAPLKELSGGQEARVRLATELVRDPRLLLLDEPTSGLDGDTASGILMLLKTLAGRGCTVVAVIHGSQDQLALFDRVVVVARGGMIAFDGTPDDYRRARVAGAHSTQDRPVQATSDPQAIPEESPSKSVESQPHPRTARWRQFRILVEREMRRLGNAPVRSLALPLVGVPLIFAVAVSIGVPKGEKPLLGFLSILSVIWMGASLSLMAIVGERSVYDHERLLFLRPVPFVSAKMATLWPMAMIQAIVFSATSFALRRWSVDDAWFHDSVWAAVWLGFTSCAAVGIGFVISALAWSRHDVANFILPLVMMLQIVFSVHVAGNHEGSGRGRDSLATAYQGYHWHSCNGATGCPARDVTWTPAKGGWMCKECREKFDKLVKESPAEAHPALPTPLQRDEIKREIVRSARWPTPSSGAERVTILVSYVTLTRYADIALRSFAYESDSSESDGYRQWRWEAVGVLVVLTFFMPVLAFGILAAQARQHQFVDWFQRVVWGGFATIGRDSAMSSK